jgi:hypothetical protein
LNTRNRSALAPAVAGIFFPQRPLLHLGNHAYSPRILHKIVETAALVKSFALAAHLLQLDAEFAIGGRHVNRITQEVGAELQAARDQRAEDYVHHRREPAASPAPAKVAVGVDGGRIHTRQGGCGPGVHEPAWREDKVACLQVLEGPSFAEDPHPQPPRCFLDPEHVQDLVKQFQQQKGLRDYDEPESAPGPAPEGAPPAGAPLPPPLLLPGGPPPSGPKGAAGGPEPPPDAGPPPSAAPSPNEPDWPPRRKERSCVASLATSRDFGKMLAAEVYARGFVDAVERAFLGDGLAYNWRIQESWLPGFTPILDFIHPLSYLYATAGVLSVTEGQRWQRYVRWMTACWQGGVSEVLVELRREQEGLYQRLGKPEGKLAAADPREVLRRTVNYLSNNETRMVYPSYRQRGLPVTSAAVESLIKEFNYRVKGTERFWNRPEGAEAILQVRAAALSEDGRLERHILSRPAQMHRRKRRAAA